MADKLAKARQDKIKYQGRQKLRSQLREEKRLTRKAKYGKLGGGIENLAKKSAGVAARGGGMLLKRLQSIADYAAKAQAKQKKAKKTKKENYHDHFW